MLFYNLCTFRPIEDSFNNNATHSFIFPTYVGVYASSAGVGRCEEKKKSETKKRNLPLHKFKSAILVLDLNGKN